MNPGIWLFSKKQGDASPFGVYLSIPFGILSAEEREL